MELRFTKTQQAMLDILSDGKNHSREELHKCCGPSCPETVWTHLTLLRKKLRLKQEDIVCLIDSNRRRQYRHVRLLASPNDGRV